MLCEEGNMEWPKVDTRETFEEMEKRVGIKKETNDIRSTQLGAYPSNSFYVDKELKIDIQRMRTKFDKVAQKYQ